MRVTHKYRNDCRVFLKIERVLQWLRKEYDLYPYLRSNQRGILFRVDELKYFQKGHVLRQIS